MQVLLDHGANPDLETAEGWSIVQECVASGNLSLAQVLNILLVAERYWQYTLYILLILVYCYHLIEYINPCLANYYNLKLNESLTVSVGRQRNSASRKKSSACKGFVDKA